MGFPASIGACIGLFSAYLINFSFSHPSTMAAIQRLNQRAEVIGKAGALHMNINAAKGLSDVLKQNLGPRGAMHMLVDGAGGA